MRNGAVGTRTIKRADLMEVSLVTFPANELARVQTVKQRNAVMNLGADTDFETDFGTGDINDPRTFERFLREQGFSRNRAKAITAKGFKHPKSDGVGQLVAAVRDKTNNLQALSYKGLNKSGIMNRIAGGASRLDVIREVMGDIAGAYRSVRGTSMPIYLMSGEIKKFNLALRSGLKSQVRVTASGPNGNFYAYECKVNYYSWTATGPTRQSVTLTDRMNSRPITIGRKSDIEQWLNSEYESLSASNALDRFDRVLTRADEIIRNGVAPFGTITRKQHQRRVHFDSEGVISKEIPFTISAS